MGTMIGEFHLWREAIEAAGLPIRLIRSQTWQAAYRFNRDLPIAPRGASEAERREFSRQRREERERRMVRWANNEWPWAAERFGAAWDLGTVAAALIGRHHYEELKQEA